MKDSYHIKVNDDHEFRFSEEDIAVFDSIDIGPLQEHVLENGTTFHVEQDIQDFDRKKYKLWVNAHPYEVAISDPLDQLIQEMGFASADMAQVSQIEAPMPGLILEVAVSEGQEVSEGEVLLILEAMKMENAIVSPREGTIQKIAAKEGDAVERKQLLITFG